MPSIRVAAYRDFFERLPKISQILIFYVTTSFILEYIYICLKTSNWLSTGISCVYLVNIASTLLQNSDYRVAFEESRCKRIEEGLREFLSRNQTGFNTEKCSKNENGIDLMVYKCDW